MGRQKNANSMQWNSLPRNLRNIMQILDSVWVLKLCRSRSTNHSSCKTVLYKAMMSTCVAESAEEISDSEGCVVELLANTPFEREEGRGLLSLIPPHKQQHPPPCGALNTLPGVTFMIRTTKFGYLLLAWSIFNVRRSSSREVDRRSAHKICLVSYDTHRSITEYITA